MINFNDCKTFASSYKEMISLNNKISRKDEIIFEKQLKKQKEEENYSFKPKININKYKNYNENDENINERFDKLYKDAEKRKTLLKDKITSIIASEDEIIGKPKIISRPKSAGITTISSPTTSTNELTTRLYSSTGSGRLTDKIDAKPETFSFKPTITKRASSIGRNRETTTLLYNSRKNQDEKLNKAKQEADDNLKKECTFTPLLSSKVRSLSAQKPRPNNSIAQPQFNERMKYLDEQKNIKIKQAQKAREDEVLMAATFQPTFKSKELNPYQPDIGVSPLSVFERLSLFEKPVEKNINITKEISLTQSDLHERLYKEAILKKESIERSKQEKLNNLPYNFQPTIDHRYNDNIDNIETNVFTRLTSSRQYMQNILMQAKSELDMSECTFKPNKSSSNTNINTKITNTDPVHIRLIADHERSKLYIQKRKEEMILNEMKDVTFSPQINLSSEKIVKRKNINSTSNRSSIYEKLNAEAEIIREHDRNREIIRQQEELKNATFCPFYYEKKTPTKNSTQNKSPLNKLNLVKHVILDDDSPEKAIDEKINEEITAFIMEQNNKNNIPIENETSLIIYEEVIPPISIINSNKSKLRKPNKKKNL